MPKVPKEGVPPERFAETTPPQHQDFSYLEIVMELQKSMAQMGEKLHGLSESSKTHDTKLDRISHEVFAAKTVLYVCGALLTIASGISVFVLNKIWDAVMLYLKERK